MLQKTLSSGVSVGAELVKSWTSYLVFLRMKIDWNAIEENEEQILKLQLFRSECEAAITFIDESKLSICIIELLTF